VEDDAIVVVDWDEGELAGFAESTGASQGLSVRMVWPFLLQRYTVVAAVAGKEL
jgi:hypothetical protein